MYVPKLYSCGFMPYFVVSYIVEHFYYLFWMPSCGIVYIDIYLLVLTLLPQYIGILLFMFYHHPASIVYLFTRRFLCEKVDNLVFLKAITISHSGVYQFMVSQ